MELEDNQEGLERAYCEGSHWHFHQEEEKGGTESVADKGVSTEGPRDRGEGANQLAARKLLARRVEKGTVSQHGGEVRSSWARSEI